MLLILGIQYIHIFPHQHIGCPIVRGVGMDDEVKAYVKKRYGDISRGETSCCSSCEPSPKDGAFKLGYSRGDLEGVPESPITGLGCGNPTPLANLRQDERVLDLGSGGGIDVFLAAKKVGPKGFAIGVDMTEEMGQQGESQRFTAPIQERRVSTGRNRETSS
jgi:SAM-dependent methyltransferase